MLTVLNNQNSLVSQFISELRDVTVQGDRHRFRLNLERIGQIIAYEISKTLSWNTSEITTPLGTADVAVLKEQPVIATILRAGLPFHNGMLSFFDQADTAFISAYRKHNRDGGFEIKLEYVAAPSLDGRVLILADPMLASGQSIQQTYRALTSFGKPSQLHIASVVASSEGVNYLKSQLPSATTHIWTAALDDELTAQAYIVPGLGDAGDLAYGRKSG